MRIFINSAVTGAGKTHAICRRAINRASCGERVIIVQPTHLLLDQTVEKELDPIARGVPVTAIHGGNSDEPVRDIMRKLSEEPRGGEVICMTHAAHERLPFVPKGRFRMLYDEAPQAVWYSERNLLRHHRLITDGLEVVQDQRAPEGYARVRPADAAYLRSITQHAKLDDIDASLSDIASKALSPHWDLYVDVEQWANLTGGRGDHQRRKLILHGLLKPSLFEGYTSSLIVGADIEESAMFHLWSREGVDFVVDRALDRDLRFTEHQNGHLLDIHYLSEMPWSKRFRDSQAEGQKVLELARRAILDRMAGQPFAYLANNDVPADFWETDAAVRLPNTSHGMNNFQHLHNVILLSALNPKSASFAFLDAMGMGGEAVKTAIARASYRQALGRGSIRNPNDENPKLAVVPDLDTAVWLQSKFAGSRVSSIGGEPVKITRKQRGRPRIHESDAARKAKARRQGFRDWMAETTALCAAERALAGPNHCGTETPMSHRGKRPTENDPDRVYATVYPDVFSTSAFGNVACSDWPEMVAWLFETWQANTLDKASNMVFVPACMPEQGRAVDDVKWSRMLALDVDDGDLKPEQFADLFPTLTMLTINSASTTRDFRRYRVLIPLDLPVSGDLYAMLMNQIVKRLERAGYWSKRKLATNTKIKTPRGCHGIDAKTCVEVLNLPAQPLDPEGCLFENFNAGGRRELDVDAWVMKSQPRRQEDVADRVVVETARDREAAAAEAEEMFREMWTAEVGPIDTAPEEVIAAARETILHPPRALDLHAFWGDVRCKVAIRQLLARKAAGAGIKSTASQRFSMGAS